ncbi:DUF4221 family protein [Algoriphagus hitonicola]|uniref:DUF4221 domain-containing protein n=1 Tax=Algoriphagus hitonicola TaxID=435880 RepID=A0A1I2QN44_9BACT|nr:DUF4221 family protein [Algoriphagus hitonicola]SFG29872.1 protein of unknown function [Algoriphagus hitonicola]
MKNYITILLAFLFFACESENQHANNSDPTTYSENQLENLQVILDTVKVDVGSELIRSGAYYGFGLSDDGQSVYFAEGQSVEIHEIDLNEMKLVQRIKFEKDGPNQAPNFINYLDVLPKREFLLANYAIQAIFDSQAEKIQDLKLQAEEFEGIDESMGSLYNNVLLSQDKKKAFSLPSPFGEFTDGLAVLDLENRSGELIKLPALDLTENFRVTFSQNGGMTSSGDMIRMQKIKDQLVIYSGSTADIYLYELLTDSLKLVTFNHQLVENKKTGEFKTEAGSNEERVEISAQMRKQINFYGFNWDESRKQYFRFGAKENGLNESGENLPADVFLFSYDSDFNLLGEKKIDELSNLFFNSFFFEGKLYNYKPVEEDPGFVVMTLNY